MSYHYITNENHAISLSQEVILTNEQIIRAINFANNALSHISKETANFDINIFEALGMRNLSGFVGECFAKSIQKFSNGTLVGNLHQDGYPDLLLVNSNKKREYYESLFVIKNDKIYPKDKALFSPFLYGGLEVKATCGSTPSASKVPKPLIGEQRISLVNSFDWKAHHRETNNLVSILWDFIDEIPTIVACFYRNDLTEEDWSRIVQPKEGGGRTTSVSIMNSEGIRKMCSGWIAVIDDQKYIDALSKKKWIGYNIK